MKRGGSWPRGSADRATHVRRPLAAHRSRSCSTRADTLGRARRRFRHVVHRRTRVRQAEAAMGAGELRRSGHYSTLAPELADDYEVSCAELDHSWSWHGKLVRLEPRLTGAGFGGSIVAVCNVDRATERLSCSEGALLRSAGRWGEGYVFTASRRRVRRSVSGRRAAVRAKLRPRASCVSTVFSQMRGAARSGRSSVQRRAAACKPRRVWRAAR